ncbi:MAG: hypothetical protein HY876_03140 [Coriobacteriales bacterium]|nr:hypothetical protein [Coriobacteriales bacterium]
MSPHAIKPHVEKAVLGFGIVNPLLALPQVYKVWFLGAVGGLSLITVSAGLFMSLLMAAWGALDGSKALWAPAAAWTAVNVALLAGILHFS